MVFGSSDMLSSNPGHDLRPLSHNILRRSMNPFFFYPIKRRLGSLVSMNRTECIRKNIKHSDNNLNDLCRYYNKIRS